MNRLVPVLVAFVLGLASGLVLRSTATPTTPHWEKLVVNYPSGNPTEPRSWVTLQPLTHTEGDERLWVFKFIAGEKTVSSYRGIPAE